MCDKALFSKLVSVHTDESRGMNLEWEDEYGFKTILCGTPVQDENPVGIHVYLLAPDAELLPSTLRETEIAEKYTDRTQKGSLYSRLQVGRGTWVQWKMVPTVTFYRPSGAENATH